MHFFFLTLLGLPATRQNKKRKKGVFASDQEGIRGQLNPKPLAVCLLLDMMARDLKMDEIRPVQTIRFTVGVDSL